MEAEQMEAKGPIIILPTDEARKQQLHNKLVEYRKRLHPYRAPESQMDLVCKIAVLERLLNNGQVDTWGLSREMVANYGPGFNADDFNNACAVIRDYCETGGQNVRGGFGLAMLPEKDSK